MLLRGDSLGARCFFFLLEDLRLLRIVAAGSCDLQGPGALPEPACSAVGSGREGRVELRSREPFWGSFTDVLQGKRLLR